MSFIDEGNIGAEKLSEQQAKLHAPADAVFDSKYFYYFWRPVTAIRAGNEEKYERDRNLGRKPDPTNQRATPHHRE